MLKSTILGNSEYETFHRTAARRSHTFRRRTPNITTRHVPTLKTVSATPQSNAVSSANSGPRPPFTSSIVSTWKPSNYMPLACQIRVNSALPCLFFVSKWSQFCRKGYNRAVRSDFIAREGRKQCSQTPGPARPPHPASPADVHLSICVFAHLDIARAVLQSIHPPIKKSRAAMKRPRPGPRDPSSWTFPILTQPPPTT